MSKKVIGGLPTDGRKKGEYATRYSDETIRRKQIVESVYLVALVIFSFIFLLLGYLGHITSWLNVPKEDNILFLKMYYCVISGLLGGATFGLKCLYRAIASGRWSEDRSFWRYLSPIVSLSFALILGTILYNNIITGENITAITIGFFSGYFSDEAAGKMYDVALVLFSKNENAPKKEDIEEKFKDD